MEHTETNKTSKNSPLSHSDPTLDSDYRPTRYGSTDSDRNEASSRTHTNRPIHKHSSSSYVGLIPMLVSHFIIMFAVMYTMVDKWDDIYINLNQFYMTMMMVIPMNIGMILLMNSMYPNKVLNWLICGVSILGFAAFFYFMRAQSFVGNEQFLKSMIPHHSGAILMCEKAQLSDPDIIKFCDGIIKAQKEEIATMKNMLKKFE